VDSKQLDMTQVDVVRLILDRHQYNQQTIIELQMKHLTGEILYII